MIPVKLTISNFLSHNYSVVDFNMFNVALILGTYDGDPDQSNGAGKSALFEAITWAIYGKSRHKKKDGVVKRDCKSCTVEFDFTIDDQLFRVIRTRDKVQSDSEVVFLRWDGLKFQNIECDTNTITDFKIIRTVGVNYDVFINSVYFKQNDISMFAQASPGMRKNIIKSLLKMEQWDLYQKKASGHKKKLKASIDSKSLGVLSIKSIKEDGKSCKAEISEIRKKIKDANITHSNLSEDIISQKSKYDSLYGEDSNPAELVILQKEFIKSKKRLKLIASDMLKNNKIIRSSTSMVSKLEQRIPIFNQLILEKKKVNVDATRSRVMNGTLKLQTCKDSLLLLSKPIKSGTHCNECRRPLTKSELKDMKEKRAARLVETKKMLKKIESKLKLVTDLVTTQECLIDSGTKAESNKSKAELKISEHNSNMKMIAVRSEKLQFEIDSINNKKYEQAISRLKLRFNKNEEKKLADLIGNTDSKLKNSKKYIDRLNIELGSKNSKSRELILSEKAQILLQKELEKLKSDFAVYDKLHKYFGKDGIQAIIIENVIEELENYANVTLTKICNEPMTVSVKTQKQTEKGDWAETFDIDICSAGRTDDFETFSGGEQFRISLALRLAMSRILAKRMGGSLGFILLDEVSSSLDDKGLDMFMEIMRQLGKDMKVLVITHDIKLKDRFDNLIVVNKTSTGSSMSLQ